jgi:hypothetical protein
MVRRLSLLLVVVSALVVCSGALGAYPTPFAQQDGNGVLDKAAGVQYVALKAGANTKVATMRVADGAMVRSRTIDGAFGIPMLTQNGLMGGLFRDGTSVVLQNMGVKNTSQFVLLNTEDLSSRGDTITLDGIFGFDALSPDGSKLYLIQHMTTEDLDHYVVRAYDLNARQLLPGRIADKAQKGWVMQGFAVNRATSATGRWVYTLYMNPGGFPFIHALDTVKGVAHCIGLPWRKADQGPVFKFQMGLKGAKLNVRWQDGRLYRAVDLRTWKLSLK